MQIGLHLSLGQANMNPDRDNKQPSWAAPRMGSAAEAGVADQYTVATAPPAPESSILQFLVSAAQLDFTAVRQWVERRGLHPDATVGAKPTAICYAAAKGDSCLMSYLLGNGASVDSEDGMGMTPLHYAAMGGDPVCVSMLVAHGAQLNRETLHGKTPLALSRSRPNTSECSDLLERYGACLSEQPPGPRMFH